MDDSPAARKWYKKVQEGKIFTCPKTFFTWSGIERREEMKREKRRSRRRKRRRKKITRRREMRRRKKMRRRKRKCKVLVMKVRSFMCPKTFLLF